MTKAKDAFNELLNQISLSDREEAAAILFYFFENKLRLTREAIMRNQEVEFAKNEFADVIQRINQNEPIQYIIGTVWFRNNQYEVNPSVLIPRPETEMIVDYLTQHGLKNNDCVLDVGTGSGCIAISIKLDFPQAKVVALDISVEALEVATRNANRLNVVLEFIKDDFLNSNLIINTFNFIVSNPPYVMAKERDAIEKNVLNYEPSLALFVPDNDPLIFYRGLAMQGKRLLKPLGKIVAEINPLLFKESIELFEGHDYAVELHLDLEGKPRMIVANLLT